MLYLLLQSPVVFGKDVVHTYRHVFQTLPWMFLASVSTTAPVLGVKQTYPPLPRQKLASVPMSSRGNDLKHR